MRLAIGLIFSHNLRLARRRDLYVCGVRLVNSIYSSFWGLLPFTTPHGSPANITSKTRGGLHRNDMTASHRRPMSHFFYLRTETFLSHQRPAGSRRGPSCVSGCTVDRSQAVFGDLVGRPITRWSSVVLHVWQATKQSAQNPLSQRIRQFASLITPDPEGVRIFLYSKGDPGRRRLRSLLHAPSLPPSFSPWATKTTSPTIPMP